MRATTVWRFAVLAAMCCLGASIPSEGIGQVRNRAVLDLRMDAVDGEAAGTLTDSAAAGGVKDAVRLFNNPRRIAPVFGQQEQGRSLMLESGRQQLVSIASSDDVSRPDAVTISGLFANLHAPTDGSFHGLFAKRQPAGNSVTNYGINFHPARDVFQLYVNDGSGYRVAQYSVREVLASRRRVHLTLCFQTADAPEADADTDVDDVEVRLYLNGTIVRPSNVNTGFVAGNSGWFTDTTLAGCVSDTPVTLAASFEGGEPAQLIADDFLIFAESLNGEDAAALFREVAGAAADELLEEQKGVSAAPSVPQVTRLSTRAVRIGDATDLVLQGKYLAETRLVFSLAGVSAEPLPGGNAQQQTFRVSVDDSVSPARCLMRVIGTQGVSEAVVFCFDHLPQAADGVFPREQPAESLPVAVSGVISGTEEKEVWFRGVAGQTISAEVEARRIGSPLDPVVELRNAAGAPLAVQWQQPALGGDARVTVTLPSDGLYSAAVHDIRYRAPGNSPWRLMLGPLPPAAVAFPVSGDQPESRPALLGSGGGTSADAVAQAAESPIPVPPLPLISRTNIVEPLEGSFPDTPVDATFTTAPYPPVSVWGRITADDQTDRIPLTVTPGQTLSVTASARRLSSPLRPEISVLVNDNPVARSNGDAGSRDPSLTWKVPEGVDRIIVAVASFTGRGSAAAAYRLDVGRVDRPGFEIAVADPTVLLPGNASVPLTLTVTRQSEAWRYFGPIRLDVHGADGVRVVPEVIPASQQNGDVLVSLVRDTMPAGDAAASGRLITLRASTQGLDADVSQELSIGLDPAIRNSVRGLSQGVWAATTDPAPGLLTLSGPPPVFFRGTTVTVPLRLLPQQPDRPPFVRYELRTTQQPRRQDPNNPQSPLLPQVDAAEFQFSTRDESQQELLVSVPLDTPESELDAVVMAEFVSQPLASDPTRRIWTAPFRMAIRSAVDVTAPADVTNVQPGGSAMLSVNALRHPLFGGPVTLRMDGLPAEVQAPPVTLPEGASSASFTLTAAANAAVGELANVTVTAISEAGAALMAPVPVTVSVGAATPQ